MAILRRQKSEWMYSKHQAHKQRVNDMKLMHEITDVNAWNVAISVLTFMGDLLMCLRARQTLFQNKTIECYTVSYDCMLRWSPKKIFGPNKSGRRAGSLCDFDTFLLLCSDFIGAYEHRRQCNARFFCPEHVSDGATNEQISRKCKYGNCYISDIDVCDLVPQLHIFLSLLALRAAVGPCS